ncbi:MAG: CvpA family protein [Pirellulaceae bacterium]
MSDAPVSAPRMSGGASLIVIAIGAGVIGYSAYLGDYVVAATAAIVLFCALAGFRMGLMRMAASIAAFAAAVYFAPQLGLTYERSFSEWAGTTGLLNRFLAIASIGLVISLLATLVLSAITTRMLRRRPLLARMNGWLGFGAGAAQGAVVVLLFLGGLLIVEPMQLQLANQDANATTSTRPETSQRMTDALLTVADHTHRSRLGPVIEQYNPFERFEPLKKLDQIQTSVRVLSNPQKIEELLHHPAITELQQRPEVKQAVANLMDDKEIREVLHSGKSIDRNTAIQLLSHPAIMELIDQPGFIEEASKVIKESGSKLNIQI